MMKLQGDKLFPLIVPLLILLFFSCSSKDTSRDSAQNLTFEVIDTLLELPYELTQTGISVQPPLGFKAVSDSYYQELQTFFLQEGGPDNRVQFHQFFFDPLHAAGMVVFSVNEFNLTTDTASFFNSYHNVLEDAYGHDGIKTGEYWVNGLFVKNYLMTDSNTVRFQLLCMSSEDDAMELHYIVPRNTYAQVVKLIESSIGSLKPKKGG